MFIPPAIHRYICIRQTYPPDYDYLYVCTHHAFVVRYTGPTDFVTLLVLFGANFLRSIVLDICVYFTNVVSAPDDDYRSIVESL